MCFVVVIVAAVAAAAVVDVGGVDVIFVTVVVFSSAQ